MKCLFMIPGKVLEKSCRSLCSGLANCIAYSHSSKPQACAIHFFLCRRTDDVGFTLKLVEFNKKLHRGSSKHVGLTHGPGRFTCFTKMKRSSPLVESPRAPHVVSKRACAVACSQQKDALDLHTTRSIRTVRRQ
ncbi:uncharacterized protein LOC124291380 [Haliotis rubra]|uniref:uncharacterized protein LOC124291380 n=1 Tax=Haliotis rubra TaxID=36100 RepID=UPI001EE4F4DD|nr:uncharacterized protein LOC124291380 [Haliotis rubra]